MVIDAATSFATPFLPPRFRGCLIRELLDQRLGPTSNVTPRDCAKSWSDARSSRDSVRRVHVRVRRTGYPRRVEFCRVHALQENGSGTKNYFGVDLTIVEIADFQRLSRETVTNRITFVHPCSHWPDGQRSIQNARRLQDARSQP